MNLPHFTRKRHWIVLVWIVLVLFVFPLTPPISQHVTADTEMLVQPNSTQVLFHHDGVPGKPFIQSHHVWLADFHQLDLIAVWVVFIPFLVSSMRERLRQALLAFLKFSSSYAGLIPSFH